MIMGFEKAHQFWTNALQRIYFYLLDPPLLPPDLVLPPDDPDPEDPREGLVTVDPLPELRDGVEMVDPPELRDGVEIVEPLPEFREGVEIVDPLPEFLDGVVTEEPFPVLRDGVVTLEFVPEFTRVFPLLSGAVFTSPGRLNVSCLTGAR
jgi:hypothetical protein